MSIVYTEITLRNAIDVANAASEKHMDYPIRQTTVKALADTGAWTLVINEAIREKLGLRIMSTSSGTLADGTRSNYCIAGPVEVIWKNRSTNCDAIVLPNADDILLGAIPLEGMDLMIHPRTEEVVGVHGDNMEYKIKKQKAA